MEVSISLAFLAGLASFLSPCVFSLVPVYISYLSGRSMVTGESETNPARQRLATLSHGIAFVVGFSAVFVILGVAVAGLGGLLYHIRSWLAKAGGVLVVIFGLHMTGILRNPFLEFDLRPQTSSDHQRSLVSSALMGVFFSAGWSPCVGPTLGAIYTLAFNGGSVSQGVQLLSAYSAGLAIPFLAASFGIGWVAAVLRRFRKVTRYVEVGMGAVLVAVGVMLFLGTFQTLSRYGFFVNLGL